MNCRLRLLFALFCICVISDIRAQICQGSLGDPIVNITFGAGQNPGAPLSAATTNYTYVSTDCPNDGRYAVRNKTEKCFDSTWFSVTDHTGDPNGYFMIVNASYDPGEFYLDTVRGLCQGSTYEFAAWLINIKRPVLCWGASQIINPDVTFRIERLDGTLLQSYNTNSIVATDPPQWKQFGFFFTTPAGVNDVVIRMVNNAPGGCGNDLGLDDITFRPCGPQITSTIVESASTTDTICNSTARTYTFRAQPSPGYNNPTYQWQKLENDNWNDISGATSTTHVVAFPPNMPPGNYFYRVVTAESGNISSPNCRVSSEVLNVYVTSAPTISLSVESPICEGQSFVLSANTPANQVNWTGPSGFAATGNTVNISNAQQSHNGRYYAIASSGSCAVRDSVELSITQKPTILVSADSLIFCEGDSATVSVSGASSYQWSPTVGVSNPASSNVSLSPVASTTYYVTGMNSEGCIDTAIVNVQIMRKPTANAGPDRNILKGASIQLSGMAGGDEIEYYWTPGYAINDERTINPTVSPSKDTTYILHVNSKAGCGTATDSMRVVIYQQITIPNAFSPNGDNFNDRWKIPGLNTYPQAELVLFDRYGREIIRRRNFENWDGTRNGQPLPVASYYYVIDLRNGSPIITGWVYLAR